MATSQKPIQLAFSLFRGPSWTQGKKKPKQGSYGEENAMYYHPELKLWVERGKEEEAEREAAGPPPPPVMSNGSFTNAPLAKRSLSQRYVLQPNLSVSSSMASLAGSQTDLAGMINGLCADGDRDDNLSGPPSAVGSTAPSPPLSGRGLMRLPSGYSSSPPSATGFTGIIPPAAAMVPPPAGGFFRPAPPAPEDGQRETGRPVEEQQAQPVSPSGDNVASAGADDLGENRGVYEAAPQDMEDGVEQQQEQLQQQQQHPAPNGLEATGRRHAPRHDLQRDASPSRAGGENKSSTADMLATNGHAHDHLPYGSASSNPGPVAATPVPTGSPLNSTDILAAAATAAANELASGSLSSGPHAAHMDGYAAYRDRGGAGVTGLGGGDPWVSALGPGAELSLRNSLVAAASADAVVGHSGSGTGAQLLHALATSSGGAGTGGARSGAGGGSGMSEELSALTGCSRRCSLSFPEPLGSRHVESPVALCRPVTGAVMKTAVVAMSAVAEEAAAGAAMVVEAAEEELAAGTGDGVPGHIRLRRWESAVSAVVASDGGAVVSLYEGMAGFEQQEVAAAAATAEAPVPAADGALDGQSLEVAGGETEAPPTPGQPSDVSSGAEPAQGVSGEAADGEAAAVTPHSDVAAASQYSQYYYQQYAYLYQYALSQGYGEADAVAYAQYYAATYAQQYEAQAPQGNVGGGGEAGSTEAAGAEQQAGTVEGGAALDAGAPEVEIAASGNQAAGEAEGVPPSTAGWQVVAEAAEDEASAVVTTGGTAVKATGGGVEEMGAEEPVYFTSAVDQSAVGAGGHMAAPLVVPERPFVGEVAVVEEAVAFAAAPLPADLTAAANAATQHHQSAVTAAVAAAAAAAAAVAEVRVAAAGGPAASHTAGPDGSSAAAEAAAAAGSALGPQLLLGLGAAGAKRLTAAVASLGATVASTAPVAAALSAASAAAAAAATASKSLPEGSGLSEDDFERIMHPGDPSKLDGPLPWELPDHLRTGRKFLALCTNWQLANPGQPYAPHLLLQPELSQTDAVAAAEQQQQLSGDVDVAAEGGVVPVAGSPAVPVEAGAEPAPAESLSSYERACRLAQFGEPVPGLVVSRPHPQAPLAAPLPSPNPTLDLSALPAMDSPSRAAADHATPGSTRFDPSSLQRQPVEKVVLAGQTAALQPSLVTIGSEEAASFFDHLADGDQPQEPAPGALSAAVELESVAVLEPPMQVSRVNIARTEVDEVAAAGAAASTGEEQSAGTNEEPLPAEAGVFPVQAEAGAEVASMAAAAAAAELEMSSSLSHPMRSSMVCIGSVDATSFFDYLGDEQVPEGSQQGVVVEAAAPQLMAEELRKAEAADAAVAQGEEEVTAAGTHLEALAAEAAKVVAEEDAAEEHPPVGTASAPVHDAPTVAAATAIDSLLLALEQLRSNAIISAASMPAFAAASNGEGPAPAATADSTSLLKQIHSSLAQATQAIAGMGMDVSALASVAAAAAIHESAESSSAKATPRAGAKRPRLDGSPSTPTRPIVSATSTVVTPLLPPGPPVVRAAGEAGDVAPGERFQELGRRLSSASTEAAVDIPAAVVVTPLVVSLTVSAPPAVDVAAVEERVRCEERAAFETRLGAVVDSEREAASLVIASLEQQRDGLQARVGELEQQLGAVQAERDALAERLAGVEANAEAALAAAGSEAAAQLAGVVAERDQLAAQVEVERSEKAALATALNASRAEAEDLRRQYAERFSSLTQELEATHGSLSELQAEHDELLLCLGQESTKVAVLTDAVREAGGDPEPIIQRIEQEYETMGLGGGEEEGQEAGEEQQSLEEGEGEASADGWEGEDELNL